MQMSHNTEVEALEKKVADVEVKSMTLKWENDAATQRIKDLEGKNSHLQSSLDKLMSEAKKKGWFKWVQERSPAVIKRCVVMGFVKAGPWSWLVLVLAEDWPSWAFSVQAIGCLDITTWCKFKSGKYKVEFTSTRLGSSLTSA